MIKHSTDGVDENADQQKCQPERKGLHRFRDMPTETEKDKDDSNMFDPSWVESDKEVQGDPKQGGQQKPPEDITGGDLAEEKHGGVQSFAGVVGPVFRPLFGSVSRFSRKFDIVRNGFLTRFPAH